MNNITIKKMNSNDTIPYDLLYLADPSIDMVERYISEGECHIAIVKNETVGVYLLSRKSLDTLEIVNIAVRESCQNTGIGKLLVENAVNISKSKGACYLEVGTVTQVYHSSLFTKNVDLESLEMMWTSLRTTTVRR